MSTATLRDRFRSLLERHVHRLTVRGTRASGLCPFHQEKTPSFSIDIERGVFHCFGCGLSGGVKRFAELVGEPWGSTRSETRTAKAHRAALVTARDSYQAWQWDKLRALTDEYRELSAECEVAETAYRLLHRRPDLFSEEEARQWDAKLAALYDRLAPLEWDLDVLTYQKHEEGRFLWWRKETADGHFSTQ